MKKTYIEPSVMVAYVGTATMICGSGARRHRRDVWEDSEEEEEY